MVGLSDATGAEAVASILVVRIVKVTIIPWWKPLIYIFDLKVPSDWAVIKLSKFILSSWIRIL